MRSTPFGSGLLGLAFLLIGASAAGAQPVASSLGELKRLVGVYSTVTVTDAAGQQFRGTVTEAAESGLSLRIAGAIRRFEAADVRSVRVRKDDSLVNGALMGAAVGAGLTSLMFLDNECRDDPVCYQAVAVYGGLGAVAGLGVDALIHRTVTVYTGRPRAARNRVAVAPIVGRRGNGVRVTVAF